MGKNNKKTSKKSQRYSSNHGAGKSQGKAENVHKIVGVKPVEAHAPQGSQGPWGNAITISQTRSLADKKTPSAGIPPFAVDMTIFGTDASEERSLSHVGNMLGEGARSQVAVPLAEVAISNAAILSSKTAPSAAMGISHDGYRPEEAVTFLDNRAIAEMKVSQVSIEHEATACEAAEMNISHDGNLVPETTGSQGKHLSAQMAVTHDGNGSAKAVPCQELTQIDIADNVHRTSIYHSELKQPASTRNFGQSCDICPEPGCTYEYVGPKPETKEFGQCCDMCQEPGCTYNCCDDSGSGSQTDSQSEVDITHTTPSSPSMDTLSVHTEVEMPPKQLPTTVTTSDEKVALGQSPRPFILNATVPSVSSYNRSENYLHSNPLAAAIDPSEETKMDTAVGGAPQSNALNSTNHPKEQYQERVSEYNYAYNSFQTTAHQTSSSTTFEDQNGSRSASTDTNVPTNRRRRRAPSPLRHSNPFPIPYQYPSRSPSPTPLPYQYTAINSNFHINANIDANTNHNATVANPYFYQDPVRNPDDPNEPNNMHVIVLIPIQHNTPQYASNAAMYTVRVSNAPALDATALYQYELRQWQRSRSYRRHY